MFPGSDLSERRNGDVYVRISAIIELREEPKESKRHEETRTLYLPIPSIRCSVVNETGVYLV